MKRLFIDTNILLDLLDQRKPFYEAAAKLATLADRKKLVLVVSSLSFSTGYYLLCKSEPKNVVLDKLRKFKIISQVSRVDDETVEKALNSKFADFEDALQYFSALNSGCDVLITRNGKDFKQAALPVMTAEEYLKSLNQA